MHAAILAALAFMIATTAPAAETLRPFKIAIEDYPPFEFVEAGKAKGIDVEVIRRIMERLDVPRFGRFRSDAERTNPGRALPRSW